MNATVLKRQLLLGAYVAILFAPLAFMLAGRNPAESGAMTLTAVGLGGVAMAAIVLQFLLVSRARFIAHPLGTDLLIRFHRYMGLGIAVLASAHLVLLVIDRPSRITDLREGSPGHVLGAIALIALLLLVALSWTKPRLFRRYERWRLVHSLLGASVLVSAFAHVLKVGHFATNSVIAWVLAAAVSVGLLALFWLRVARPFWFAKRPFRVVQVAPERGDAVTVVLKPEHGELHGWHPGQFGWLKLADRPYSLTEHPFSMSSSACNHATIAFTCKAVGDFTNTLKQLQPGTRLLIDGPHGSHRPAIGGTGRLCIVAGSGIGAAMSILRTMDDLRDPSPVLVIYGVRSLAEATFLEELDALKSRLQLDVIYVASREAAHWHGLHGRIDQTVIRRLAPADVASRAAFVCGPGDLVDTGMATLSSLGVPVWLIHGERF